MAPQKPKPQPASLTNETNEIAAMAQVASKAFHSLSNAFGDIEKKTGDVRQAKVIASKMDEYGEKRHSTAVANSMGRFRAMTKDKRGDFSTQIVQDENGFLFAEFTSSKSGRSKFLPISAMGGGSVTKAPSGSDVRNNLTLTLTDDGFKMMTNQERAWELMHQRWGRHHDNAHPMTYKELSRTLNKAYGNVDYFQDELPVAAGDYFEDYAEMRREMERIGAPAFDLASLALDLWERTKGSDVRRKSSGGKAGQFDNFTKNVGLIVSALSKYQAGTDKPWVTPEALLHLENLPEEARALLSWLNSTKVNPSST